MRNSACSRLVTGSDTRTWVAGTARARVRGVRHLLVMADSLAFHGPERAHPPSDPRLYPQVMAASLSARLDHPVEVDLVARLGWTARDGWWALTKDPRVWGELLPRADALVVGLGGMDHLPAAVPTFWREGIAYVRPGGLRRAVRRGYLAVAPYVVRATNGRLRQLPQAATDRYLTRIVEGVRTFRPGLPVVALTPSPYRSDLYPSQRPHVPAVAAARAWAGRTGVHLLDLDPLVGPALSSRTGNPDGMHWSWDTHRAVGAALAEVLARTQREPAAPRGPIT